MAYGHGPSSQDEEPEWGFLVFIIIIGAFAALFVSLLVLMGNGSSSSNSIRLMTLRWRIPVETMPEIRS